MSSILEDKDSIRETLANYCFYTDSGQADRFADLFTKDGVWDGGPFGYCGDQEALRAFMKRTGAASVGLKHMTTNIVIDLDGDHAWVKSYVLVLGRADQGNPIFFAGHYHDVMVRRDGSWLFKSRRITADLTAQPASDAETRSDDHAVAG